jgi:hypothetical protein
MRRDILVGFGMQKATQNKMTFLDIQVGQSFQDILVRLSMHKHVASKTFLDTRLVNRSRTS